MDIRFRKTHDDEELVLDELVELVDEVLGLSACEIKNASCQNSLARGRARGSSEIFSEIKTGGCLNHLLGR